MSVQSPIAEALIAYLETFDAVSPTLDIVDSVETTYKPTINQEYLETRHLIAPTNTIAIATGRKQYMGIFQVTVVYPAKSGIVLALALADEVVEHFEKGTIIDGDGVRIKVTRQPDLATPTPDGAWLRVPVSINYQCMA